MNKFDPKKVISIAEFFYNSVSCHFPKILGTKNKPFPNKKKPIVTSGWAHPEWSEGPLSKKTLSLWAKTQKNPNLPLYLSELGHKHWKNP